jgi:hypothetical protein
MSSALITIDYKVLKKQQAKEALDLLRKLTKINESIVCFNTSDQQLFKNWSTALLHPLEEKIDILSKTLNELSAKQDQITAISDIQEINYLEAYRIYCAEEEILQSGSEEEKKQTLRLREKREKYITLRIQSIYDWQFSNYNEECMDETQNEPSEKEDLFDTYLYNMAQTEKTFLKYFADVLKLKAHEVDWENHLQATRFMTVLIERARISGIEQDWKTYFTALGHSNQSFQKHFKKYLKENYKIYSELDLLNMQERSYAKRKHVYASQQEEFSPEADEEIKLLYRKLVRQLHPDSKLKIDNPRIDQASLWQQTQDAYEQNDKTQLEYLEKYLCLVRGELDHLNTSDFSKLSNFLEVQLFYKRLKNKELRKQPGWRFSKKKSFDHLEKRLKAPYLKQIHQLEYQIHHLQKEFAIFEKNRLKPTQLEFEFQT